VSDRFDDCLTLVLKHEGGFSNNPKDPGGMTNLGVTKKNWDAWINRTSNENEFRLLTKADVSDFYHSLFWKPVRGDELPAGVDYVVFDCAVNSGPARAIKILQSTLGVRVDGVIGQQTLDVVNLQPSEGVIRDYTTARLEFLKDLNSFDTFGAGWTRRVNEVMEEALGFNS
jgi:lysozyme family protein